MINEDSAQKLRTTSENAKFTNPAEESAETAAIGDEAPLISQSLLEKRRQIEETISRIGDGATVMIGGFGIPGTPFALIEELVRHGARNLTIVKNDANEEASGVDLLLRSGQVDRLITSHIGLNPNAVNMMNQERISVEFVPQGILAERIRAGGAGLLGIVSDVGIETELTRHHTTIDVNGYPGMLETSLRADFALLHSASADLFGNLVFEATARNFNPLMGMAADETIVEVENLVELGGLDAERVHLSGIFVDSLVQLDQLSEAYNVKS